MATFNDDDAMIHVIQQLISSMPTLLRAYIIATHNRYRNHTAFRLMKRLLESLCQIMITMLSALKTREQRRGLGSDGLPFDPKMPGVPVSYPLKTLEELESRCYFDSFHYPYNKCSVKLEAAPLPQRQRNLVCHDMQGGYTDDKWIQGGTNPASYAIWHWYLIDVFVYFSHNLVTLPPPCWTNAAHKHGVKVLGTFILEWNDGIAAAKKLLATKESARMYAERLSELAVALGFDGWLLNFEVELDVGLIPNLEVFISHLTQTMHSSQPGSLVIWYDGVCTDGRLSWQDQLNSYNKPFFDLCDGIFVNYTWVDTFPKDSALMAGDRKFDVYMGIDVFGRGTYGGGQWKTDAALEVIKRSEVSAAIFAPGWVYETHQPPDFETAQNRWWSLVEKSWGISQKYPKQLPFYSNFDQGRGSHISVNGVEISRTPWNNISSQSFQPFLQFPEDASKEKIQVFVDFKEASYGGGGNIVFKGSLSGEAYFTARLFHGELVFFDSPLDFTYSVKSNEKSCIGLSLKFSRDNEADQLVLLASHKSTLRAMNHFFPRFRTVIWPHQVTKPVAEPGWVLQQTTVDMSGFTLTEINAVCYMENPPAIESEYYALLGHVSIHHPSQNVYFPPASLWRVEGKLIKWNSESPSSGKLSLELQWELKTGSSAMFPKYFIYVQKMADSDGESEEEPWYLGPAEVAAFYVSDLEAPSTSCLKFIIQVCDGNGAFQNLDESPFLHLKISGLCQNKADSCFRFS